MIIRFIENIYDGDKLLWKKSYLYRIVYESEDSYYLETELPNNLTAIKKDNLELVALVYPCNYEPMIICKHCKYLKEEDQRMLCTLKNIQDDLSLYQKKSKGE